MELEAGSSTFSPSRPSGVDAGTAVIPILQRHYYLRRSFLIRLGQMSPTLTVLVGAPRVAGWLWLQTMPVRELNSWDDRDTGRPAFAGER